MNSFGPAVIKVLIRFTADETRWVSTDFVVNLLSAKSVLFILPWIKINDLFIHYFPCKTDNSFPEERIKLGHTELTSLILWCIRLSFRYTSICLLARFTSQMTRKGKQSIILAMVIFSVPGHYLFKATNVFVQRFFCSVPFHAVLYIKSFCSICEMLFSCHPRSSLSFFAICTIMKVS